MLACDLPDAIFALPEEQRAARAKVHSDFMSKPKRFSQNEVPAMSLVVSSVPKTNSFV
jgi:hypothetical protein